ncbi:MAG: SagB/ThcOx family dehydrogenase [Candidatus Omnitrophica bacterium]|nr:SagB/ThcOx family dehydrogenase [Candidatus Omnitrophota bacterium]MCM8807356.1 SagB/ThcOx family dehydrogenase [Candidatus Omnitrophota bacterium]
MVKINFEMKKFIIFFSYFLNLILFGGEKMEVINLPPPSFKGKISVEEALKTRRSIRSYKNSPLNLKELSQILWASDGKTVDWGGRTAPSAGATYPLEIYVVVGNVEGLKPGLYYYDIDNHSLKLVKEGDLRNQLSISALGQSSVRNAPIVIVIAGVFERTTSRYGKRGERYVFMEVGHVGQNIHLQAESLGLGTVMIGAFEDEKVKKVLGINEDVFYLCPVGRK